MKTQLSKFLTLCITLLLSNVNFSQSANWIWANKVQSNNNQIFNSKLAIDNSNQTILSGDYTGSMIIGATTHTTGSFKSAILVKNDNFGMPIWSKSYGSFPSSGLVVPVVDVTTNSVGDIYVLGTFSTSLAIESNTLTGTGSRSMYVAKFDQNGNYVWGQAFSSGNVITPNDLHVDNNGIYVTGSFLGTFSNPQMVLGTLTITCNGPSGYNYEDFFIAKFDLNGVPIWANKNVSGPNGREIGKSVVANSLGDVYVVGDFKDGASSTFGTYTLTAPSGSNGEDCFIVKYDSNGNALWANKIGSSNIDFVKGINIDNLGNPIVVGNYYGTTFSAGTFSLSNSGSSTADLFAIKLTSLGGYTWAKKVTNGAGDEIVSSVSVDNLNNINMAGKFSGGSFTVGSNTLTLAGGTDMFIVKLDDNGNDLLASNAGNSFTDDATSVVTDTNGDLYVTGQFLYQIAFGSTPMLSGSLSSGNNYLSKLAGNNPTSFFSYSSQINNNLQVYPNPTNKSLTFLGNAGLEKFKITIFSITGSVVYQKDSIENILDVSELNPGIYFIELTDKNGINNVVKFIKQ